MAVARQLTLMGVVGEDCAIEIEARVDKQVRRALVDLLLHHCSKKLLVLIPAWMNRPAKSKEQCEGNTVHTQASF